MKRKLTFLIPTLALAFSLTQTQAQEPANGELQLFELRTYHTHPGKLEALHKRFREHTCQLFAKHGMTNIGYWVPQGQPETLIYLLGYKDQEAREASWKAFQHDPAWKAAYTASHANGPILAGVDSMYLKGLDYGKMKEIKRNGADQLWELRIYTTEPGKLEDLNARFRNHTCDLFEKHGIKNFAYFVPVNPQDGSDNKLVYLVSHKDQASRDANFKTFGADEVWKKAKADSEKNGPLVIKDGISSTLLVPTDYSPVN